MGGGRRQRLRGSEAEGGSAEYEGRREKAAEGQRGLTGVGEDPRGKKKSKDKMKK